MKFAFVTCVQLGLSCIEKIYSIGGKLDLLITLYDHKAKNKSGRIYLDDFAEKNRIELLKINHINDPEVIAKIKNEDIDWLFIIGWSQIANDELLAAPQYGAIGMHPTLLPIGRGRASIPWAILKGLGKTGVTMFKLDKGVDTGPIMGVVEITISKNETATELYSKVNNAHEELIEQVWASLSNGSVILKEQDGTTATYWEGRTPEDGQILESMTLEEADRLIRATTIPYPGAFFYQNGKKIIVWSARTLAQGLPSSAVNLKLKDGYLMPIKYDVFDVGDLSD